jgi:hypothetical protein
LLRGGFVFFIVTLVFEYKTFFCFFRKNSIIVLSFLFAQTFILPMRSFLSIHFYLFFILICLWACEPKTVEAVEQKVETFSFEQFPDALVVIDHNQRGINVTLPYQTILSKLVPRIQITNGHSLVPASGIEQDFSKNVYYTLIQNKQKTVYTVKVKNAPQPQPIISQVLSDSVEAGFEVTLKGKNFGIFAMDVKAYLLGEEKMEVPFKLLDSNRLVVQIPITVKPESYRVQIAVKALLALSEKPLVVGYPSPQVKKISHKHALLNDTLFVEAQYADASKYTFACELATSQNTYKLPYLLQRNGSLGFKLPTNMPVGTYQMKLLNVTT